MIFKQYKILHLNLEHGFQFHADTEAKAYYCVYWYKSIPLGHSFIPASVASDPNKFFQECLNAITPALSQYINISNTVLNTENLHSLLSGAFADLGMASNHICDISVVICTRNRAAFLKNCLIALRQQLCKPAEIIVVDNGSATRETKLLARQFGVRYVREDKVGLDIARNTGARAANHSIVAFVDDDTVPDPAWAFRVSETFADENISAMTGLILAGSLDTEAEVIFEKYWPFNRGFVSKIYDYQFFSSTLPGGPPVWKIGAGANMAFRKTVFDDVGYFDERLDAGAAGCSGDSELWYRILANGLNIRYNPLAVVHHFHRNSVPALKRQLYSYMRGFTVAILIQYDRFGHRGNLAHLFSVLPKYYLRLIKNGFPMYNFQYQTVFAEIGGVIAGMFYYLRHRHKDPRIYLGP